MKLTPEQQQSILQGNPVPIVVQNTDCFVVRRDLYERFTSLIAPEETYNAILEAWDASGAVEDGEVYR